MPHEASVRTLVCHCLSSRSCGKALLGSRVDPRDPATRVILRHRYERCARWVSDRSLLHQRDITGVGDGSYRTPWKPLELRSNCSGKYTLARENCVCRSHWSITPSVHQRAPAFEEAMVDGVGLVSAMRRRGDMGETVRRCCILRMGLLRRRWRTV